MLRTSLPRRHGHPRAGRPRKVLALVAALFALPVAGASAMTPPPPDAPSVISVEPMGYGAAAEPQFWAKLAPVLASNEVRWQICDPECGGVVATGQHFQPASLPVGSTVQASTTIVDMDVNARSVVWWGTPNATTLPGIDGELRVGRVIAPAPGQWVGGWKDDGSFFTYRLCRSAAGDDCRHFRPATGSHERITVDPAWAGWYLGTIEHRHGPATAAPAIAYPGPPWGVLPASSPLMFAGPLSVAGTLAGPIPAARPATRPGVTGTLAVGRSVRPRSGSWSDVPTAGVRSGLRACPTRKDSDRCVAITDFARPAGTPLIPGRPDRPTLDQPARIDPQYLGWYVGAVDVYVRDLTQSGPGVLGTPADLKTFTIPAPSPVVVHGPLSRTPVRLGFAPRATIRARATTHSTRPTTLGTIRCQDRCVARATIVSGGRTTTVRLVVAKGKTERLTTRAGATRGAQARITIRFDHHPKIVRKTTRLI